MIRDGALLVDVRTPEEFSRGHIDGAINIPHSEIASRAAELGEDKSRGVVLYSGSGPRSSTALTTLSTMGFSNLFNAGNYQALRDAE